MEALANAVLSELLRQAESCGAQRRTRAPSVALTDKTFAEYRALRSLDAKEAFETVLQSARAEGAVALTWDGGRAGEGFIRRVTLADIGRLAAFLGVPLQANLVTQAAARFAPFTDRYPVLAGVLARWASLRTVRGLGPEDADSFVDAARVLDWLAAQATGEADVRLRVASMAVFGTSKRLERLAPQLDIVRAATLDEEATPAAQLWAELGLVKEPQPALFAGNAVLVREELTARCDRPYVGLAPGAVRAVAGHVERLLTVENLTNFHAEAVRLADASVLVVYTAGMPSPAWGAMYRRLLASLPAEAAVAHWGDVDEGGFRIAAKLAEYARAEGRTLVPERMHPLAVPAPLRVPAPEAKARKMAAWAERAGWLELACEVLAHPFMSEQEGQEPLAAG